MSNKWKLHGKHTVAIGQDFSSQLTQVFNFETRTAILSSYDWHSGNYTAVMQPFKQFDKEAIDYARKMLVQLGGTDPHENQESIKGLVSPLSRRNA